MSDSLHSYLLISTALFALGIFGLLSRRNMIALLISLELILNSASLNFVAFNRFVFAGDKTLGQVFSIFIIALAAAEVCVALTLILLLTRQNASVNVEDAKELRG